MSQDQSKAQKQLREVTRPVSAAVPTTRMHSDGSREYNAEGKALVRRAQCSAILQSKTYYILLAVFTLLSFTLDDIRELAIPHEADDLVDGVLLLALSFFACDIILKAFCHSWYLRSFPFCMDLTATIGLILSVRLTADSFLSECSTHCYFRLGLIPRAARLSSSSMYLIRFLAAKSSTTLRQKSGNSYHFSQLQRLRKVSSQEIGSAPSGDNLVFFPTFTGKLGAYNTSLEKQERVKKIGTFAKLYNADEQNISEAMKASTIELTLHESRTSKVLTRRAVSFLVSVVIYLALISWATSLTPDVNREITDKYGLKLIAAAEGLPRYREMVREYGALHSEEDSLEILMRLYLEAQILWEHDYQSTRAADLCTVTYMGYTAVFSIRRKMKIFAIFDLCMTVLYCVLLLLTCVELSSVLRYMILFPLEKMIRTVEVMSQHPLSFAKKMRPFSVPLPQKKKCCSQSVYEAEEEITALELAFRKIGIMLALVYGSAGSETITNALTLDSDFSPINQGKKVVAVFSFARICNFDALLSRLQQRTFQYVNVVSALVHSVCERYMGVINRNLGDSYLLVWRFPERELVSVKDSLVLNPFSAEVKNTASLAVLCAVKALWEVTRSMQLHYFLRNKAMEDRQLEACAVTFGLHVGWAFEGPIGSAFKIDASYLSPHVNLASRLESATKQYNVHILISGEMWKFLDSEVQSFTRLIDCVLLKGVQEEVQLYSFDIDLVSAALKASRPDKRKVEVKRARLKEAIEKGKVEVSHMFTQSTIISILRRRYQRQFFESYGRLYSEYTEGRWAEALETSKAECLAQDGPTNALLAFMHEYNFEAPITWRGVRELRSK